MFGVARALRERKREWVNNLLWNITYYSRARTSRDRQIQTIGFYHDFRRWRLQGSYISTNGIEVVVERCLHLKPFLRQKWTGSNLRGGRRSSQYIYLTVLFSLVWLCWTVVFIFSLVEDDTEFSWKKIMKICLATTVWYWCGVVASVALFLFLYTNDLSIMNHCFGKVLVTDTATGWARKRNPTSDGSDWECWSVRVLSVTAVVPVVQYTQLCHTLTNCHLPQQSVQGQPYGHLLMIVLVGEYLTLPHSGTTNSLYRKPPVGDSRLLNTIRKHVRRRLPQIPTGVELLFLEARLASQITGGTNERTPAVAWPSCSVSR